MAFCELQVRRAVEPERTRVGLTVSDADRVPPKPEPSFSSVIDPSDWVGASVTLGLTTSFAELLVETPVSFGTELVPLVIVEEACEGEGCAGASSNVKGGGVMSSLSCVCGKKKMCAVFDPPKSDSSSPAGRAYHAAAETRKSTPKNTTTAVDSFDIPYAHCTSPFLCGPGRMCNGGCVHTGKV